MTMSVLMMPMLVSAQATGGSGDFGKLGNIFKSFTGFINDVLIPLIFALAVVVFFYGVFKYMILGGGDEGSRDEGKKLMLWAIVGFVVMVSLYGIIGLVSSSLGIDTTGDAVKLPSVLER